MQNKNALKNNISPEFQLFRFETFEKFLCFIIPYYIFLIFIYQSKELMNGHNQDDNDQGQFQLIQEDVDEEKISLDDYGDSQQRRRSTDPNAKRGVTSPQQQQEFFDPSNFKGDGVVRGDGEWIHLDKQADLIAEQVNIESLYL